ncbi:MAG: hypothetical protein IPL24_19000 [Bacteroidetes bacterium]|nr:hypothetical protein [Bacteroidota bacterium]
MKKLLLIIAIFIAPFLTNAQSTITVSGDITTNTNWTNNNQYILSGFVYVTSGAELTIQEGTIIKGDKTTKGSLIITRGSKINAQDQLLSRLSLHQESHWVQEPMVTGVD